MFCGIDLGSSSVKCAIVDESGTRLGFGKAVLGGGAAHPAELRDEPAEWRRAAATACRAALAEASDSPARPAGRRVEAVAVSGNGPTLVAVDSSGSPIGKAAPWMDRSALGEAARASEAWGRRVDPSFYLPKALRILEAAGAGGPAVAAFFSGPEYLAHTMGAEPVSYLIDPYYESYVWNLDLAEIMGMDRALFPRYVEPGRIIGTLSARAAGEYGLPPGIPIVSAFPDFLAALVGSDTMSPGMACDRTGSSEALNLCAVAPCPDAALLSLPHAASGLWNVSGGLSTSGRALEWFSAAGGYEDAAGASIFGDFSAARPGAGGAVFLPYLAGERAPLWKPDLRGAFTGLSLTTGRAELARAVVESLAYGLRLVADRLRENGLEPRVLRCSGGAAANAELCALKADVLGLVLETQAVPDCEPVGDACACAVALGRFATLEEAARAMARPVRRYEPNPALAGVYGEAYARWRRALDAAAALEA